MKSTCLDFDGMYEASKTLIEKIERQGSQPEWCHGVGVRRDDVNEGFYIIIKALPGTKSLAEKTIQDIGLNYPYEIEECRMARAL